MTSPKAPTGDPAQDSATPVVELLDRVDRAVDAAVQPVTSAEGISREGWRVLLLLARGGGCSMGEIADYAAVPAPTATRVVDRLVVEALAYRRSDSSDRRRVLVHLAPRGRDVVDRISGRLERQVDAALAQVEATRRDDIRELLEVLAEAAS